MPLICKWKTDCSRCGEPIEEGDDLWLVESLAFGKEKICRTCASLDGRICDCGNDKKPEHLTCWNCKVEQEKHSGTRCVCGRYKRPQYPTCYSCKRGAQQ